MQGWARPTALWRVVHARLTVWNVALAAALVAYVVHFSLVTVGIHRGLGSSAYDVGLYDQGVWLLSRFQAPFVTLMGRNLMGDHTSFILVALVPLYWLRPGVPTLYIVQTVVLALGAVPVFLYARRCLQREWMALVCAAAYLAHPAVSFTNIENFHPDAFLGVLVGGALYAALQRRWRLYALFVAAALLVKEDVSLVVVPLGIWVALRRDRRAGLITVVASVAFMAVAMLIVMRSLIGVATRNTWRVPFGGPRALVHRTVSDPGAVVDHLRADGRPFYLWQMTAPFAAVLARRPGVAAISAAVLLTNILSTFWYQYSIQYHYSLVAVPALALGTVHALGFLRGRTRVLLVVLVGLVALWTSHLWSALPWSRFEYAYWPPDHPVAEALRDIVDEIPADASVSAFHSATPHLAHRREIYQFPNPFRAVLYGTDDSLGGRREPDRAEGVDYVLLPDNLDRDARADWRSVSAAFERVSSNDAWVLYRRDPRIPLPPAPSPAG